MREHRKCAVVCTTNGSCPIQQHYNTASGKKMILFVFRWSIPLGARRVMEAVKEGHKSTLSSAKMVALAAGLSVGATVGYIVYRHISSPNNSKCLLLRSYCPTGGR